MSQQQPFPAKGEGKKHSRLGGCVCIEQRSPTFLAPGTGFVEDNFSTDGGLGGGDGSGGNARDGERWAAADEASLAHLLLCGPVPNRPWPGGWGPLVYIETTSLSFSMKWLSLDHPVALYLPLPTPAPSSDFYKSRWFPCGECLGVQGETWGPSEGACHDVTEQGGSGGGDQAGPDGEKPVRSKARLPEPHTWVSSPFPQHPACVLVSPMSRGLPEGSHSGWTGSEHRKAGRPVLRSLFLVQIFPGIHLWALLQHPGPGIRGGVAPRLYMIPFKA